MLLPKRRLWSGLLLLTLFLCALRSWGATHELRAEKGTFVLDGKPFQIISGEIHYPRVPRAAWKQRLAMARAMGLNTVTMYTFWNVHEPQPGVYDFNGDNDVAEFVREAQRQGLWVILRPGPYVCAEWEFGGFPSWLLRAHDIRLRTTDPRFMQPVKQWLKRLGQELAPLQAANGGPILAVQVENEYGSFGDDHDYMRAMRQAVLDAGFGNSLLYSSDGGSVIAKGSLPGMLSGVNFGAGKPGRKGEEGSAMKQSLAELKAARPEGPCFVGEYWDGWFDHYGEPWVYTDAPTQAAELEYMLRQGCSISIYMFLGGTSFGWMNGANSPAPGDYAPDVTSYDYDAVLKENGEPSPKYGLFREAIARVTGVQPPPVPAASKPVSLPAVAFTASASLWSHLPEPKHSEHPLSMEDLGQSYGYLLYRTHLTGAAQGELKFDALHEYARVYVNGKLAGTLDRRKNETRLALGAVPANALLDVLVENTGRINFGPRIAGERIGILGDVSLSGQTLLGWAIYPLPMERPADWKPQPESCAGPCFYRAQLTVTHPADTYLDTRELGKGQLWVNGRNLGRFWSIGPQGALYLPASWLHRGKNDIVIFDLDALPRRHVRGLTGPVTDFAMTAGK